MKENKRSQVWIGAEDRTNSPEFFDVAKSEFVELPIIEALGDEEVVENVTANRRDFLKYLGFGLGAATVAASCDIPIKKAIPYVTKPDSIVPGIANYYASSFVKGGDYCSILVKTREGRPIKIEGNSLSPITQGGTSARAQASVLDLYDTNRHKGPMMKVVEDGKEKWAAGDWAAMDSFAKGKLNSGSKIRLVANTIMSPSTKKAINEFRSAFPNSDLVMYDPISSSAILEANDQSFGDKVVPGYHFDKADVIVSFGADFLGTWISPVEYAADYIKNRTIKDVHHAKMSRHVQVESGMSLTGSNADERILIRPSEQGSAILHLYNAVASKKGGTSISGAPALNAKAKAGLNKIAAELAGAKHSLIVSNSNNVGEQTLVNAINNMLGNYGSTITFNDASLQRQGTDGAIQGLVREMNGGGVDAVIMLDGANPAFDLPNSEQFAAGLAKVGTTISLSMMPNETSVLCSAVAPAPHFLESWGDVEPKRGQYSLIQPTISPLFNTRQVEATLMTWANSGAYNAKAEQPMYDFVKTVWSGMNNGNSGFATQAGFWDNALHDGVFGASGVGEGKFFSGNASAAASKINKPSSAVTEIAFMETVNIGAGQYADNPWLQEMPDPVSRTTWGNVLYVPLKWNGKNDFDGYNGLGGEIKKGYGNIVKLSAGGKDLDVTATTSFGQPYIGESATVSMALGYGRTEGGQGGIDVGQNAFPMLSMDESGNTKYYADAEVSRSLRKAKDFACVQYHHTMGVYEKEAPKTNVDDHAIGINGYDGAITNRSVIFGGNLDKIIDLEHEVVHQVEHAEDFNSKTLYPFDEYSEKYYSQGHHWAMHVDMNACIGCGACTIACMSENNIPVVGKKEVHRHHEMAWIRIDRYFIGDVENPNVVYQPMMCQHCDNAPCENVCPVAATNHSAEGLNQMTYNRCIGTRYCANNCPYKVRRFNWLDYTTADLFPGNQYDVNGEEDIPYGADNLTRMVLNPDVTVRSRGVIEKCSFCVQRIQEGKLTAKAEGRGLREGDVRTACQTACPTGAIVFGDKNDKKSLVAKKLGSKLNYRVLGEINTQSSVYYSAKVLNKKSDAAGGSMYGRASLADANGGESSHGSHDSHGGDSH